MKGAYMTERARIVRMSFPPPFHGERTCPRRPPVPPFSKALVYRWSVIVIRAAPRISTRVIGMKSPNKVSKKTLVDEMLAGSLQL